MAAGAPHQRMQLLRLLNCLLPKTYQRPRLDRIDIHVDYEKLAGKRQVENSETIRKRVQGAREQQLERLKGTKLVRGYGYGRKLEMERSK